MARPKKNGRKRARRNRGPSAMIVTQNVDLNDPVLEGFDKKKAMVTEQYQRDIANLDQGREAYITWAKQHAVGSMVDAATALKEAKIPLTRKGTPDMRSKAAQEYVATHPEVVRAD